MILVKIYEYSNTKFIVNGEGELLNNSKLICLCIYLNLTRVVACICCHWFQIFSPDSPTSGGWRMCKSRFFFLIHVTTSSRRTRQQICYAQLKLLHFQLRLFYSLTCIPRHRRLVLFGVQALIAVILSCSTPISSDWTCSCSAIRVGVYEIYFQIVSWEWVHYWCKTSPPHHHNRHFHFPWPCSIYNKKSWVHLIS